MGAYLLDRLRELLDHSNVGDVRGKGLFAGVELIEDKASKTPVSEHVMTAVVAKAAAQGVLVGKTTRSVPGLNNTVNIAPPLIVTKADIDELVEAVTVGIEHGCRDL